MQVLGNRTEQADGLCHEEGGGHALAGYVTQTEVEIILQQQIAVKVATDFLRWRHRGINIQIGTIGEGVRNHALLDIPSDTQVALNTLLRRRGLLQLVIG